MWFFYLHHKIKKCGTLTSLTIKFTISHITNGEYIICKFQILHKINNYLTRRGSSRGNSAVVASPATPPGGSSPTWPMSLPPPPPQLEARYPCHQLCPKSLPPSDRWSPPKAQRSRVKMDWDCGKADVTWPHQSHLREKLMCYGLGENFEFLLCQEQPSLTWRDHQTD